MEIELKPGDALLVTQEFHDELSYFEQGSFLHFYPLRSIVAVKSYPEDNLVEFIGYAVGGHISLGTAKVMRQALLEKLK